MNDELQAYINEVKVEQNRLFLQLQEIILRLYPNAEIVSSYKIPKYKVDAGWVSLGYWKGGVSIHERSTSHSRI
jgi:hypothetical protein